MKPTSAVGFVLSGIVLYLRTLAAEMLCSATCS